ncbi:MAG: phage holin family protein [Novosphingobium sp.]|nr:phage holin family protein [Novosphingobium sp.]
MDQVTTQPIVADPLDDAARRSLIDDIRRLADDGKTLAEAELAFQSSRARLVGASASGIATYAAVAVVLAFFAVLGLVVGLLLALTPLITAWGATTVVVGGLLLAGWIAFRLAMSRWRRLNRLLSDKATTP